MPTYTATSVALEAVLDELAREPTNQSPANSIARPRSSLVFC